MMTLEQIKVAVEAGQTVYWSNPDYTVIKDSVGQWMIAYRAGYPGENYIGLTWQDGVTMNGKPEDFYTAVEPVGTCLPLSHAPEKSNADVMATAHAFVKTERLAKYARWAAEEVGKAVSADDTRADVIRSCAASHLADRLAISDGLTLLQVGEAHTTLAESLVAAVPLYVAGCTGSDPMYFADVAQAREYVAQGLDAAAIASHDSDSFDDTFAFRTYAAAFRNLSGNSSELTLFGVSYYVRAV